MPSSPMRQKNAAGCVFCARAVKPSIVFRPEFRTIALSITKSSKTMPQVTAAIKPRAEALDAVGVGLQHAGELR